MVCPLSPNPPAAASRDAKKPYLVSPGFVQVLTEDLQVLTAERERERYIYIDMYVAIYKKVYMYLYVYRELLKHLPKERMLGLPGSVAILIRRTRAPRFVQGP